MEKMKFESIINHFLDVVSKDKDIDLSIFYHNLETLDIIIDESKEKSSDFDGFYSKKKNKIIFTKKSMISKAIYHELFHCSSTIVESKTYNRSGFRIDETINKRLHIQGIGLNEGYTEILNERYFINDSKAYPLEKVYIKQLEKIIDPKLIKQFYFSANLNGLINELKKYATYEEIQKFINYLDLYNCYDKVKSIILDVDIETVQKGITYCSDFLSNCYARKMVADREDEKEKKMLSFINEFKLEFKNMDGTNPIHAAVSLEAMKESLEICGIGIESITKEGKDIFIKKK